MASGGNGILGGLGGTLKPAPRKWESAGITRK